MPNIPNTNSPDLTLVSVGNGTNASRWINSAGGGGGSGITQLTDDVTAGPGSGSVASTVEMLQGITLNASGAYAPTTGQVLAYSTVIANQWLPMGGTPTSGSQLYWNGIAWTSTATPTANAQILIWNSSTSAWVSKTLTQDISVTNAGVVTVDQLQGTTLNVSGTSAPSVGNFLTYSNVIYPRWSPSGGTPTTGSMLWWNGIAWTNTPTPATGNVWKWTGSAYAAVTPLVSGDTAGGDLSGTYPNPTIGNLQGTTLSVSGGYAPTTGQILAYGTAVTPQWNPMGGTPTTGSVLYWNGIAWTSTTPSAGFLYWNGSAYSYTTAGGGTTNQAWAITNQNAGLALTAGSTNTPSAWTITASGFSNYLVQISCTVRMTTATAGTCSIGIQVGGSLYGATSGTTYGALNAQSVTVNGSYLLSSVSGTQVIQGQVAPGGSSGVFYNGNMTVIGIS